jgi:hypothetical protein
VVAGRAVGADVVSLHIVAGIQSEVLKVILVDDVHVKREELFLAQKVDDFLVITLATVEQLPGHPGFRSDLAYYSEAEITIAIAANSGGVNTKSICDRIAGYVMKIKTRR